MDKGTISLEEAINEKIDRCWIPVSERLPEPNTKVLITLIDHRRRKVSKYPDGNLLSIRIDKIVDYEGDMTHPFWAKGDTPSVIAWMPLPEPYRGN